MVKGRDEVGSRFPTLFQGMEAIILVPLCITRPLGTISRPFRRPRPPYPPPRWLVSKVYNRPTHQLPHLPSPRSMNGGMMDIDIDPSSLGVFSATDNPLRAGSASGSHGSGQSVGSGSFGSASFSDTDGSLGTKATLPSHDWLPPI